MDRECRARSEPTGRPALDVRLDRIEAGPRRGCCRPWGRRGSSEGLGHRLFFIIDLYRRPLLTAFRPRDGRTDRLRRSFLKREPSPPPAPPSGGAGPAASRSLAHSPSPLSPNLLTPNRLPSPPPSPERHPTLEDTSPLLLPGTRRLISK